MEKRYSYSILNYKHSVFLGESLNIGVLIYFINENRFHFEYSNRLSRIKSIYSNVSEKTIKHYLGQISKKVDILNKKSDPFFEVEILESLDSFIGSELLPIDGSSLQFKESVVNFQNSKNNQEIIDYLSDSFLFELNDYTPNKDYLLTKKFYDGIKGRLNKLTSEQSSRLIKDYVIKNETGTEFKFSYAWQNGSLNLIKPINFDLTDANNIARKAYLNYGQFVDLSDEAERNNLRYDLLIGIPKKRDLFKEYEHSLSLLSKIKCTKIILEDEIDNYSEYAISAITE